MKRLLLCVLTSVTLLLGGCHGQSIYADYREIDQIELVQVIGIDSGEDSITTTVSTGAGFDGSEPKILKSSANTIKKALESCQEYTDKKYIFFAHTAHLLLGEDMAKESVESCLEYVERAVALRMDTFLYVVKNGSAENAVSGTASEETGSAELLNSLHRDVELLGNSYVYTCGEVAAMLERNGCGVIAAIETEESGDVISGGSKTIMKSVGYAVIRDGRLAAFTDSEEASGVTLLLNKVKSDIIEIPNESGGFTALKLSGASAKYRTIWKDGEIEKIKISVKLSANIEEIQNPADLINGDELARLRESLAEIEKARIERALALSRKLNTDFLQLEHRVRSADPVKYSKMSRSWQEAFGALEIELELSPSIERTYDTGNSGR